MVGGGEEGDGNTTEGIAIHHNPHSFAATRETEREIARMAPAMWYVLSVDNHTLLLFFTINPDTEMVCSAKTIQNAFTATTTCRDGTIYVFPAVGDTHVLTLWHYIDTTATAAADVLVTSLQDEWSPQVS